MAVNGNSAEIFELESARERLRTNDIDADNFANVGLYLKALREANQLSVADLSQRTHIKPSFIEAIEQTNERDMPARPFAIGFVRSIAETLGANADRVVKRFKREAGYASPESEAQTHNHDQSDSEAPGHKEGHSRGQLRGQGQAKAHGGHHGDRDEASFEHREMSLIAVLAITAFIVWCAFAITSPRDITTPVRLDGGRGLAAISAGDAIRPDATPAAIQAGLTPAPASVVVDPTVIYAVEPVYPFRCEAEARAEETVSVIFTVSGAGRIANERVQSASNPCFERAALNAIRQWRFSPRTVDGVARPVYEQTRQFTFVRP